MDHFEALIRLLLEREGYWTRQSEKVRLTKSEKAATGKPSIPRPELDIVALKSSTNEILVMEVKSYLDSGGVRLKDFEDLNQQVTKGHYKLFTCPSYRRIVFKRLLTQYIDDGLANEHTKVVLGLAAGKIYSRDEADLEAIFDANAWVLWKPSKIAKSLRDLAETGYENDPFIMSAKLLGRNPPN